MQIFDDAYIIILRSRMSNRKKQTSFKKNEFYKEVSINMKHIL